MQPKSYEQFTQTLQKRLDADQRVLGLIALGSMAEPARRDQWSDHDFWVITQPGCQEAFLSDLSWLPSAGDIVLAFRQAVSYHTLLYRNGHSIEFAVFDREQLQRGKTERFAMLLDKANLTPIVKEIQEQTVTSLDEAQKTVKADVIANYFFLQLLTAVQRYARGEILSSQQNIHLALDNLLFLIKRYIPAQDATMLDSFDTRRHFERIYPTIAQEIYVALQQASPDAERALLEMADKYLAPVMPAYPLEVAQVIRETIHRAIGPSTVKEVRRQS